jgi:hypothetical protein
MYAEKKERYITQKAEDSNVKREKEQAQGYMTLEGNTTPSERTIIIGRRLIIWESGGRHPIASVQRTST